MKKAEHSENRPRIALDSADPVALGILVEALGDAGYRTGPLEPDSALCLTTNDREATPGIGTIKIGIPFRIGAILKALRRALDEALPGPVRIGPYVLRPDEALLVPEEGETIRLTDRERDTLLALARAPGRGLERRALLETVWLYAEGVETHTVETHIYRLRQKIEPDPASPSILLTDGQGYRLAE